MGEAGSAHCLHFIVTREHILSSQITAWDAGFMSFVVGLSNIMNASIEGQRERLVLYWQLLQHEIESGVNIERKE